MSRIELGWVARPATNEYMCGDHIVELTRATTTTVAVIDGLGHGPRAAASAETTAAIVRAQPDEDIAQIFAACDRALESLVGACMTLVRIDHGSLALEHAGIGDIAITGLTAAPLGLEPCPGHLGGRMRKLVINHRQLAPGDRLLIHSDGISRRLDLDLLHSADDAHDIAKAVLAKHGKSHDDASCVVVIVRA